MVFLCVAADAIFSGHDTTVVAQGRALNQTAAEADVKSAGCITCHTSTDEPSMHPTGTVRLGCTDCHGGNADVRAPQGATASDAGYVKAKRSAHPSPRLSGQRDVGGEPRPRLHGMVERVGRSSSGSSTPATCASPIARAATCHAAEVQQRPQEHDDPRRDAVGRGALQQRRLPVQERRASARATAATARRSVCRPSPPPTAEETRTKGVLPFLDPLPRWEVTQPGNVLRVFERGGRQAREIGIPDPRRGAGPAGSAAEQPRPRHAAAPTRCSSACRRRACSIRCSHSSAPTTTPATTAPAAARPATSSTPTTARRCTRRSTRRSATTGASTTVDPTIPKQRARPSDQAHVHAVDPVQPVHDLPHAPGTNMVTTYFGYTWWDNETDGELMYPAEQRRSERSRPPRACACRNPEGAARSAASGRDPEFLDEIGTPEFNAKLEAHAVRRLPRPRLGVPRRLQARPQGRPARRRRTRSCPHDDPQKFGEGGAPEGHPPREGDALRRLPLQAGQPRQRQAVRRDAQRGRDRLRRLPRHRRHAARR